MIMYRSFKFRRTFGTHLPSYNKVALKGFRCPHHLPSANWILSGRMLWGGLRPIYPRVALDFAALVGLLCATFSSSDIGLIIFSSTCSIFIGVSGFTKRWTISFPMIPLIALHALRYSSFMAKQKSPLWWNRSIQVASIFLIVGSFVLCLLFPPVELPPTEGPFHVGVVEFYLETDFPTGGRYACQSQLPVRLFYPTLDQPGAGVPFLNDSIAIDFCRETMDFGAPGPLKPHGWFLHTWRLTRLRAKLGASLIPGPTRLPIVVFSHGLGGSAHVYSYQSMALASRGYLVLQLNHQDGSAPVIQRVDGSKLLYDKSLAKIWKEGFHLEYVVARRERTELRARELIAAAEALHRLNGKDIPQLNSFSLKGRLAIAETFFMGHSFGGATALTAAYRRPDLVHSIVAHEPAVDWLPDDVRQSLFDPQRLVGVDHNFQGGTGGFGPIKENGNNDVSIHDKNMLILFSHDWVEKKWAGSDALLGMHAKQRFGPHSGISTGSLTISAVEVIDSAHHNEFSDTCMMTPIWLARDSGLTGKRNPLHTAQEIHDHTIDFLTKARRQAASKDD